MCMCMYFRIYFSNFSQSKTVCTSNLLTCWDECLCMNRVGRNKNRSTVQYCVTYYVHEPICAVQRQRVVSLEFVQTVSQCVRITSTFYNLQYLIYKCQGHAWKGVSGGYTLNKST